MQWRTCDGGRCTDWERCISKLQEQSEFTVTKIIVVVQCVHKEIGMEIIISSHCCDHYYFSHAATTATLHIYLWMCALYLLFLQKGSHPLHTASFNNRLECVELLLNNDAQINLPTDVSYHCNMYYQWSLAVHMTASLMYVGYPLIFIHVGWLWSHRSDLSLSRRQQQRRSAPGRAWCCYWLPRQGRAIMCYSAVVCASSPWHWS